MFYVLSASWPNPTPNTRLQRNKRAVGCSLITNFAKQNEALMVFFFFLKNSTCLRTLPLATRSMNSYCLHFILQSVFKEIWREPLLCSDTDICIFSLYPRFSVEEKLFSTVTGSGARRPGSVSDHGTIGPLVIFGGINSYLNKMGWFWGIIEMI